MEDKIEANMGLVVSVVNSFNPKSDEEREEYIQAGRIGLWKALQKYDPDRGCKFSPYARNPIRWEIIKTINNAKKYNNQADLNNVIIGFLEVCGDEEFWETIDKNEVNRLENLYGEKLIIERVEYDTT